MFALIRKDLIACRLFLLIGLAMYVLWAVSTIGHPLGYFILNIGTIIVMVLAPIVLDDKYRVDTLVCFLPPSRSKVVLARYIMALIALLAGLGAQYGFGAILNIHSEEAGFWTLCAPQAVVVFCIVPVVCISLYLPCFFRFGLGRGSLVFATLTIVLATLMTSPLFATDLLSANGGFVLTREMLQHPGMGLVAVIDHIAEAIGSGRFYAVAFIGSVILVIASVAFSLRFFQRRDF